MRYANAALAVSSVVYAAGLAMHPAAGFSHPPRTANAAASAVDGGLNGLTPRSRVPATPAIKTYFIRYPDSVALRDELLNEWVDESNAVSAETASSKLRVASVPHGAEDHPTIDSSVPISALYGIVADPTNNALVVTTKTNSGFDMMDRLVAKLDVPMRNDDAFGNEAIDMDGFLRVANEAAGHRESRRISEADFIRMSKEPGTIVLDARSRDMFDLLHVEGAINLPFADISIASLRATIPDKNTRILIYCNNNFRNNERAFSSKNSFASLNLSTYATLYGYGYRNIYELGPRNDVNTTALRLVPSRSGPFGDTEVAFRLTLGDA